MRSHEPPKYSVYYPDGVHMFANITKLYRECYKIGKPIGINKFLNGRTVKGRFIRGVNKGVPWIVKFK